MSSTTAPTDVATMTAGAISGELRALLDEERGLESRIDALAAQGDEEGVMRLMARRRVIPARRRALRLGDIDRQEREMREEERADRQRAEERRPRMDAAAALIEERRAALRESEEAFMALRGEADLDALGRDTRARRRRDLDAQRRLIAHPERAPVPSNVTPIDRAGFGPSRFAGAVDVGNLPA